MLTRSESGNGPGRIIVLADRARDAGDWLEASQLYRQALDIDENLAHIWVQYGHALKESGSDDEAEGAYRKALVIDDQADTHIQLGHLLKKVGRRMEAIASYKNALKILPNDPVIKKEIKACQRSMGEKLFQNAGARHIYFDISDLIFYLGHHDNLTGIQRVQASIILALVDTDLDATIHFLTYVNSRRAFHEIDQLFVISLLEDLSHDAAERLVDFDREAARDGYVETATSLRAPPFGTSNVLCILGAAWVNVDYFLRVRNLKNEHRFRFTCLVHDMIPIFARETCDQGTAEVFTKFMAQCRHLADGFFCVSQSTRSDLLAHAAKSGWQIPIRSLRKMATYSIRARGPSPSTRSMPSWTAKTTSVRQHRRGPQESIWPRSRHFKNCCRTAERSHTSCVSDD